MKTCLIALVCFVPVLAVLSCSGEKHPAGKTKSEQSDPDFEKRFDQLLARNKSISSSLAAKGAAGVRNEVVFFGDSMTAGYGIDRNLAFPALIDEFWRKNGVNLKAVNAGVSGNTAADLSFRIRSSISKRTLAAFVSIGANDYFMRTPVCYVRSYYEKILSELQSAGIEVIIGDVSFPRFFPGFEEGYTTEFNAMTPYLAKKYGCRVLPSIHAPVFMNGALLSDKRHADPRGHQLLAEYILSFMNSEWKYKGTLIPNTAE